MAECLRAMVPRRMASPRHLFVLVLGIAIAVTLVFVREAATFSAGLPARVTPPAGFAGLRLESRAHLPHLSDTVPGTFAGLRLESRPVAVERYAASAAADGDDSMKAKLLLAVGSAAAIGMCFYVEGARASIGLPAWVTPLVAVMIVSLVEPTSSGDKVLQLANIKGKMVPAAMGMFGSTLVAVKITQVMGATPVTRAVVIGMSLFFMRVFPFTGFFPPAAAFCSIFVDRTMAVGFDQAGGFMFPLFPCTFGTMFLWLVAPVLTCTLRTILRPISASLPEDKMDKLFTGLVAGLSILMLFTLSASLTASLGFGLYGPPLAAVSLIFASQAVNSTSSDDVWSYKTIGKWGAILFIALMARSVMGGSGFSLSLPSMPTRSAAAPVAVARSSGGGGWGGRGGGGGGAGGSFEGDVTLIVIVIGIARLVLGK